ncbi:MAG: signal peptidase II [Candidatus Omnitrophica bacterium]|nr:signal peptidase II [Candidatus Omnitrophota bacterium]
MSGSTGTGRKGKTAILTQFYGVAFLILILDQLTKFIASLKLISGESFPVIENIFHLTLVHNKGIAFGFFYEHPLILLSLISLSILILAFFAFRHCSDRCRMFGEGQTMNIGKHPDLIAFAFILGGAAGNWLDRIRYGAVIDFLDFRIWPVFNVADSAITVGVGLYLIYFLKQQIHQNAETSERRE